MVRAPALDALRGLAALAIVVLHAWLYTTTVTQKGDSVGDAVVHQLRLGVPLFFCLSGFLLYGAWVRAVREGRPLPAVATYARRRAARILPAYAVALAGSLALLVPFASVRGVDVPDAGLLPLFAIFASNLHPATAGALDPPMWTLAVEVQFYALLPAVAWLALGGRRRAGGWLLVPPLALLVGGTLFNAVTAGAPGSIVVASSLPALAPCFACGMAAALVADARVVHGRGATVALLLAGALLIVADGAWHEQDAGLAGRVVRDLPAAVGFAAVILVAARPRAGRLLGARPFRVLGELSFPLYLWHMPLMLGLRGAGVFPEGRPAAALAMVLAVTLPVAWLSWTCVERPAVRWTARRADRPGGEPAARPAGRRTADPVVATAAA
jgi:peptidoglycan/LPS O-acetylase OafA/YrhL